MATKKNSELKEEKLTDLESIKIHSTNNKSKIEEILKRLKVLVIRLNEGNEFKKVEEDETKFIQGLIPEIRSCLNDSTDMLNEIENLTSVLENII